MTQGFKLGPVKRSTFVIDKDLRLIEVIRSEVNMNSHADKALAVLRARAAGAGTA